MRVLEAEEDAGFGAHVGGPVGDVVAVEEEATVGHFVFGGGQHARGESALAAAVGTHDRVHLAGVHREVQAAEDLGRDGGVEIVDGWAGVQVLHLEEGCGGGGHGLEVYDRPRITPMAVVEIPASQRRRARQMAG